MIIFSWSFNNLKRCYFKALSWGGNLKMLCISFLHISGAQAELQRRLALTTLRKTPLERRKWNTQHLLVSTSVLMQFSLSSFFLLIVICLFSQRPFCLYDEHYSWPNQFTSTEFAVWFCNWLVLFIRLIKVLFFRKKNSELLFSRISGQISIRGNPTFNYFLITLRVIISCYEALYLVLS